MYFILLNMHELITHFSRINSELLTIENKHGIRRCSKDSDVYLDLKRMEGEKEKNKVLESMVTSARERWFLLNLKAKFAGIP